MASDVDHGYRSFAAGVAGVEHPVHSGETFLSVVLYRYFSQRGALQTGWNLEVVIEKRGQLIHCQIRPMTVIEIHVSHTRKYG